MQYEDVDFKAMKLVNEQSLVKYGYPIMERKSKAMVANFRWSINLLKLMMVQEEVSSDNSL